MVELILLDVALTAYRALTKARGDDGGNHGGRSTSGKLGSVVPSPSAATGGVHDPPLPPWLLASSSPADQEALGKWHTRPGGPSSPNHHTLPPLGPAAWGGSPNGALDHRSSAHEEEMMNRAPEGFQQQGLQSRPHHMDQMLQMEREERRADRERQVWSRKCG